MTGFFITDFAGMVPRASARLLANNQAQNAVNAKLLSGELEALKDALLVVTPSKAGTKLAIYRFGQDVANEAQYWFHWTTDVDVARGPVNNDSSERTYWTGETEPRVTDNAIALLAGTDYPMNWYKLGIPKPVSAPVLATDGAGTGEPKAIAVVYTYVSAWGEEGPPSDPSDIVNVKQGDELTISTMSVGPGAGYNITAKRIYAAITGSTGSDYQLLAEIAVAVASHDVTIDFETLGEVIPSKTWIPPETGLRGLIAMANGMMAGFLNNDVWLCEPYLPHAWPARYRKSLPFGVVGLGTFDTNLVVVTKGGVYAGPATHPSALSLPTKATGQAGVSKRGIVSFPGGVAYPCAAGLAWIDAGGWRLATDGFFTRDQWQALVPSSISGYRWGNRYVGFYDDGAGTQRGFIFDPADPRTGFVYTDLYATAGYNDPQRDALYLQIGNDIKRWDANGTRAYTWKSKVFTMPKQINPAVAQVIATSYPVTFKLYADGVLKDTMAVANKEPFSLSSGYKARDFEVQLEGAVNVRGVAVAESHRELRDLVT
jgi:hypothetical protein